MHDTGHNGNWTKSRTQVNHMAETIGTKNIGLRGITVADTKISKVEGDKGNLYYRGYNILDLAKNSTFEETAYLLIHGRLPQAEELRHFSSQMILNRDLPDMMVHNMQERPSTANTMDVLQSAVSLLADYDADARDETKDGNYDRAMNLIAKLPTIVAYWERIRHQLPIVRPRTDLTHSGNFLYMLHGEAPHADTARDLDIALVLHADHTFNASTFAAREVASTRAHMYAAVSAACGALSGELHGGANTRVMEMLLMIGDMDNVEDYVRNALEGGDKVFGMGHAVYKTYDPRMYVLQPMSQRLGQRLKNTLWYDMSVAIMESTQKHFKRLKGADIYPNVDFFSASAYYYMGIPPHLFTPIFALSRVAGWCAHVVEEKFAEAQPKPQLYRPHAEYIGNYCGDEGCVYEPMSQRGGAQPAAKNKTAAKKKKVAKKPAAIKKKTMGNKK